LVEEQFEALENSRYNALMEGLEEALEKWNWEYKLLRPDEAEEEEVDKNIKQLEKQLKLTFLQQKIRKLEEVNIKHTEEEKILNIPSK
jgi:hypothetical protein